MTAVEASTLPLPKHGLDVNMEDRKRPATHDPSDSTPPLKKQATTVNGNGKPHPDADMPWKDDLERVQKDAILRQMQEYKREKATLESRLRDVTRSTTYHNDHLRIMDSWFKQLIDEVKVLLSVPDEETKEASAFPSALLFSDNKEFEEHLKARSDEIKTAIARLSSRSSKSSPEIASIQAQLTKKLAEEKVTLGELEKNISEKQQLEERLDAASLRYMVAEKKIDRAKSTTVAKLEKQYILGPIRPNGDSGVGRREEKAATNGAGDSSERFQELVDLSNRANAISEKRKEHVEQLEVHNSKLMSQATELNMKMTKLSDDDYAHTDLFKQLKSQHEEVIKRVNHLEAKNVQLREEAQKLQAERTTYRVDIEKEARATLDEREAQLSKAEQDLARIRNARDELLADQQIRKATMDQEKASILKMKQFQEAKDSRIAALQSEIERLKLHTNSFQVDTSDISTLPLEELQTKYKTLDKRYEMLNTELISMQTAYQKASKLAYQKINDASIQEERLERLSAEKAKADQKYFSAMKSKEARDSELRTLRLQNMKSSDIISQLKDADNTTRTLLSNVEKQLAETKDILDQLIVQNHVSQNQIGESTIIIQGLRSQVAELQKISVSKDSSLSSATSSCRKYETEIEGLKSTLAGTKKSLDSWKNKSLGNSSSEYEMLRSLAICTVCRRNFKNTAIKTCGHVFCKECVEERLTSRSRKCPNCNKSFGNNDYMHITL